MSQLGSAMLLNPGELQTSTSGGEATLGAYAETADGRGFRYVKNGATAMVVGRLQQSSAEVTDHQNMSPAAAAVGASEISIKLGATALLLNEYAGGLMIVTANAGEGHQYLISGHSAVDASGTVVLKLADDVRIAIDANSTVDMIRNPYSATILSPTAETSAAVGWAVHEIAGTEYGWLQTHGPVSAVTQAVVGVGLQVVRSTAEAGAVSVPTSLATDNSLQHIGYALTGIADSNFGNIYATID